MKYAITVGILLIAIITSKIIDIIFDHPNISAGKLLSYLFPSEGSPPKNFFTPTLRKDEILISEIDQDSDLIPATDIEAANPVGTVEVSVAPVENSEDYLVQIISLGIQDGQILLELKNLLFTKEAPYAHIEQAFHKLDQLKAEKRPSYRKKILTAGFITQLKALEKELMLLSEKAESTALNAALLSYAKALRKLRTTSAKEALFHYRNAKMFLDKHL